MRPRPDTTRSAVRHHGRRSESIRHARAAPRQLGTRLPPGRCRSPRAIARRTKHSTAHRRHHPLQIERSGLGAQDLDQRIERSTHLGEGGVQLGEDGLDATALVKEMGIALDQAAAFVGRHRCSDERAAEGRSIAAALGGRRHCFRQPSRPTAGRRHPSLHRFVVDLNVEVDSVTVDGPRGDGDADPTVVLRCHYAADR